MTLYCSTCRQSRYAAFAPATCPKCGKLLSSRAKPTKPKRKYTRKADAIVQREPAPKFRLQPSDVWRSPGGRTYDER